MPFITNGPHNNSLANRLKTLISKATELKFLVGFFYFSGLRTLYECLRENTQVEMKVLVGLNVDRNLHGLIEYANNNALNNKEISKLFYESLEKSINGEELDNPDAHEQIHFFKKMIQDNRLIIHKTIKPNHAKLYIFKLPKSEARNSFFITGSSNLTRPGLQEQDEFNIEISDHSVIEAEEYFDRLWEDSVPIYKNEEEKKIFLEFLENKTLIKQITPLQAYAYVLKTYLDTYQGKVIRDLLKDVLEEKGYRTYNYQLDAVKQALSIIEQHNGVIIADVVGLGKTIIACAVALELNKRGIVIAPPGLIGDKTSTSGWEKYLEDFQLSKIGWKTFSTGLLEDAYEFVSNANDIEVIIVDEAHRFRNQDTQDYEWLKNICRGKIVILLTATPFNNRPDDIFSLLKLFIVPQKSSITLSDDLRSMFISYHQLFEKLAYIKRYAKKSDSQKQRKASKYYKEIFNREKIDFRLVDNRLQALGKEIKSTIEPIIIRRNRLDLKGHPEYSKEINELSEIEDPKEWFFELSKEQSNFYDRVIKEYFAPPDEGGKFKGAIYRPYAYQEGIATTYYDELSDENGKQDKFKLYQQYNLFDFMRRLLVKRFESSFGAFKQSLNNFLNITQKCLKFIENSRGKYILDRSLLEKIYDADEETIEEELNKYMANQEQNTSNRNRETYDVNTFKQKDKFIRDIRADIKLFKDILDELGQMQLLQDDPKLKCLIRNIREQRKKEPARKIVIFSEYNDTVEYLKPHLNQYFPERVLVIKGNLTKKDITDLYENFDASCPAKAQKDDYDILLTTDKISEGFNLNRAGMIINYDIPWNPVRVIQRVGRINRISKKVFDKLYIVNFFPTEIGSNINKSREIARNKMLLIHHALGEDAKIFDIDEEPNASELYKRIQSNPDNSGEESFYTRILKKWNSLKSAHPELEESIKNLPPRIKVAKSSDKHELYVVIKKGKLFVSSYDFENKQVVPVSVEDMIDRIEPKPHDQPAIELSKSFWDAYMEVKKNSHPDAKRNLVNLNTANSLEQKAINVLKTLIENQENTLNKIDTSFIEMLLEDVREYGTLPDSTLRRIIELSKKDANEVVRELNNLEQMLGKNYLEKEKEKLKKLNSEIIIAIENIAASQAKP